jgi:hypothetical protein
VEALCSGIEDKFPSYLSFVKLIRVVIEIGLYYLYAQGSSAAEFWNLTRNGFYCHFGGYSKAAHGLSNEVTLNVHDTCRQVRLVYSTG